MARMNTNVEGASSGRRIPVGFVSTDDEEDFTSAAEGGNGDEWSAIRYWFGRMRAPKPAAAVIGPSYSSPSSEMSVQYKSTAADDESEANSLLATLRASSPTRTTAETVSSEQRASWMKRHPSALDKFDRIIEASKGKQIVMFLDYDGTLSPIVPDPNSAHMSPTMRATVKSLASYFPTAIVTGRSIDKVYDFVQLPELYYAGSHGMDIIGPSRGPHFMKRGVTNIQHQPAANFIPIIQRIYATLREKTSHIPGAYVEDNKFCVTVHFRRVEDKMQNWEELVQIVRGVMKGYSGLRISSGRKVMEIRPAIDWDKGQALTFLLKSLGYAYSNRVCPIYIGDDRTDEDAFRVSTKRITPRFWHCCVKTSQRHACSLFLTRTIRGYVLFAPVGRISEENGRKNMLRFFRG
ncbi:unnamed protein product [Cuscuta epithymum]|uniref:Trehalose 6-phosphate phosphatase n=1 Tax=Cuscuta epithymum TaxID=186058 RepID=A0AAV0DYA2_9ASTE|nr:unnamed protein product [Cuscuta epithymum]